MKLKLAIIGIVMLGNSACVTTTNTYSSDIVYRDGSYYSPADEQNGDYYYEPEYDYSYYDDYPYYGNAWYGGYDGYRCRFSYRYDRYCDGGWGSIYLNFGGLSLIFGDAGYGYGGYGYPYYGYYDRYPYYGGYPHHDDGHRSPRPDNHDPIAMPKPVPSPFHRAPGYGIDNRPGVRVPGEPILLAPKPALVEQAVDESAPEPETQGNPNPYTRSRQNRVPRQPVIWQNAGDDNAERRIIVREDNGTPRVRYRPVPAAINGGTYGASDPATQPEPRRQREPANGGAVPEPRPISAPRVQPRERVERVERVERIERTERPAPVVRQESRKEGSDDR